MDQRAFFEDGFRALTGKSPFRWQQRLYGNFVADRPDATGLPGALDIPTGLGKTSVIPIWLLALAARAAEGMPSLPRRLVYVVNRRTVVDQATDTAMDIRQALREADAESPAGKIRKALRNLCIDPDDDASPLAISTLRGEYADNREWQADPARAAIIIGTVDMIGSRLLFSGYGVSRRMRPFHAGLIGQDALLVHDEAHLSPAFCALLSEVTCAQRKAKEPRPLRVMELSATQRVAASKRSYDEASEPFSLTEDEKQEDVVRRRAVAAKALHVEDVSDSSNLPSRIAAAAVAHSEPPARVVIYVRTPRLADEVTKEIESRLEKSGEKRVGLLTGTLRGYERDRLVEGKENDPAGRIFTTFRATDHREPLTASLFLVATSAGEVGVDLDADHLVCDLTPLDSMIQRLGRVNRLGRDDPDFVARIDVFAAPAEKKGKKADEESVGPSRYEAARQESRKALDDLAGCGDGRHDASPTAMRVLIEALGPDGLERTFSPMPRLVPVTDILLDAWALTSPRDVLPGRPPVERWLHGVESGPPDLHVAWREEVALLAGPLKDKADLVKAATALFDCYPILTHERLRGPVNDVVPQLVRLAKRNDDPAAILLPVSGPPVLDVMSAILADPGRLGDGTIVLCPGSGGLNAMGLLDADAKQPVLDVADELRPERSERMRVLLEWNADDECWKARCIGGTRTDVTEALDEIEDEHLVAMIGKVRGLTGMIDRERIICDRNQDGEPLKVLVLLISPRSTEAEQETSSIAPQWQALKQHLEWASEGASMIVGCCGDAGLPSSVAEAVVSAAKWHDVGKQRDGWQAAIGHTPPRDPDKKTSGQWEPWAKSDKRGFDDSRCGRYRHEFGSIIDAAKDSWIGRHPECDLILHSIATHHGWARPHFEEQHWDISPDVSDEDNVAAAAETMRRYARLQRRFGRWGLAWLEALVRAADYAATRRLSRSAPDTGAPA